MLESKLGVKGLAFLAAVETDAPIPRAAVDLLTVRPILASGGEPHIRAPAVEPVAVFVIDLQTGRRVENKTMKKNRLHFAAPQYAAPGVKHFALAPVDFHCRPFVRADQRSVRRVDQRHLAESQRNFDNFVVHKLNRAYKAAPLSESSNQSGFFFRRPRRLRNPAELFEPVVILLDEPPHRPVIAGHAVREGLALALFADRVDFV